MRNKHKVISWLVIAFVAFYLVTQPDQAAAAVRGAGDLLVQGFEAVGRFFQGLA